MCTVHVFSEVTDDATGEVKHLPCNEPENVKLVVAALADIRYDVTVTALCDARALNIIIDGNNGHMGISFFHIIQRGVC